MKKNKVVIFHLFALYFSPIVETASENAKEGVWLEFRTNGGLFTQQRFKLRNQTIVQTVRYLVFADDYACVDKKIEDIQWIGNKISRVFKTFGRTMCIEN